MWQNPKVITLIPGDGIGPEISEIAKRCISGLGVDIRWDIQQAGAAVMEKEKKPLPERVLDSIKRNKVALKGPIETPIGAGFRSVNVELRQKLDLYACVRPSKYYEGIRSRILNPQAIDIVIVRENTEDLYAGIEFMESCGADNPLLKFLKEQKGVELGCDTGISIKPISVKGSERIVTFAFEYARKYKRRKVTAIDKANIMKYTDGLFMNVAAQVSKRYPDITYEHVLVDNMCMQLVQFPEKYDVLVLPNLYGDIISDLVAGLVGGLGVAPGVNMGDEYAVFEATHGSAPDIAGQNKANPTGMLFSAALMLEHIGEVAAAKRLELAVAGVLREGKHVTADLRRDDSPYQPAGTREMGDAVIERIQ
ncbi:MAG: isocitrate/isopropylmalate dehydrogenase family protein [Candidatus Lindowbacteria bacterium]|nr:isocitrate/isopropylmalate dehydrogenase family protein [Candidatus Lindowbacteria bacterium]